MNKRTIFTDTFKGLDQGLDPSILKDGYSPDCNNWLPHKSKDGVHGIRKGSKTYRIENGYPITHMHNFRTRTGDIRLITFSDYVYNGTTAIEENTDDLLYNGSQSQEFRCWDSDLGGGAVTYGLNAGTTYLIGNETNPSISSYTPLPYSAAAKQITLGNSNFPLRDYKGFKIVWKQKAEINGGMDASDVYLPVLIPLSIGTAVSYLGPSFQFENPYTGGASGTIVYEQSFGFRRITTSESFVLGFLTGAANTGVPGPSSYASPYFWVDILIYGVK